MSSTSRADVPCPPDNGDQPGKPPGARDARRLRKQSLRRHDREIFALAIPAFGALVAEPLFLMADSAMIGHLGTAQLAGLGVAAALLATVVNIFVFLAYATTAAVSRSVGAGDLPTAIRRGMDGIWLALL
ncbi:MATE family efflux transporter, partial [Streptomyces bacillaris]|uniref:MATE family efflux transporter n=1 Tax=Streptomyces bacillaris TaxID=68179 RepID=UPI00366640A0